MKKIIISPYSKKLPNNKINPKNYPYWQDVIDQLKDYYYLIQIGVNHEKKIKNINEYCFDFSLKELKNLILNCDLWISVDNFMGHLGYFLNKKGIVVFGKSDPKIFGYNENINILKNNKYLRKNQFLYWSEEKYQSNVFVSSKEIVQTINNYFNR